MRYKATPVDAVSIERATWLAQKNTVAAIRLGQALQSDAEREQRHERQLCPSCYYTRGARIAGAAVTQRPCGLCNVEQTYGSTATDTLCLACARKEHLCKRCGGDINSLPRPRVRKTDKT